MILDALAPTIETALTSLNLGREGHDFRFNVLAEMHLRQRVPASFNTLPRACKKS